MKKWCWQIVLLVWFCLLQAGALAQTCVDDYFSIDYATSTVQNPANAIITPEKEILLAGSVLRNRSVCLDGWLTKLSPQGTILWSRNYTSVDFNWIHINKAVADGNEGYILAGNIGNVDTTVVPPAILTQMGFLMKVDRYGNKLWTKMFGKNFVAEKVTTINNIIATTNGDFILVLNYSGTGNSSNIIVRIDGEGNIKWTSSITSSAVPVAYGSLHVHQLNNGDLAVASTIQFFDNNNPYIPAKQGYYAASIDYDSGLPEWQRTYIFTGPPSTRERTFGDVVQVADLPNGDLSFISSYADTSYIYFRKTKKVINMITDDIGRLKNIKAYSSPPPLYASAAVTDIVNGGQVILMDNADAPFLMKLDAAGNIEWQHAYPLTGRSQETRTLLSTEHGFYFFSFTHNGGSKDLKLVKTDLQGNADCVQAPSNLIAEDISDQFRLENLGLSFDYTMAVWHGVASLFVGRYKMEGNITCRNVCCADVTTTAEPIDLCNVNSYTLPNNDVITSPGTYGVTYKTSRGCDSIVYYNISFSTNPIVNLGNDACLEGKDSVVLSTKGGYNNYSWMGANRTDSFLTVKQPGTYFVRVNNACGSTADTVEVYMECDFGIYIPNAFTPNGDNLNDLFGLPKQNKNKLLSLQVYNRWGQLIYHTNNREGRWDGTFKGRQAPTGIYTYVLIVETLDKKRIVQKGWINLIR
jgi:gliding motility-associated-like protein